MSMSHSSRRLIRDLVPPQTESGGDTAPPRARPVQRHVTGPLLPSKVVRGHWDGRDTWAEAQVVGLAVVVFGVAALQALAGLAFAVVGSATRVPAVSGALSARDEGVLQLLLLAPPLLLALTVLGKLLARRSYLLLAFPLILFSGVGTWAAANVAQRFGLSLLACAGLTLVIGLALRRLSLVARWLVVAWAGYGVYAALSLVFDGLVPAGLYACIPSAVALVALLHPRTATLFRDDYDHWAAQDQRRLHLVQSLPLWLCAGWAVLPLGLVLPSFLDLVRD